MLIFFIFIQMKEYNSYKDIENELSASNPNQHPRISIKLVPL